MINSQKLAGYIKIAENFGAQVKSRVETLVENVAERIERLQSGSSQEPTFSQDFETFANENPKLMEAVKAHAAQIVEGFKDYPEVKVQQDVYGTVQEGQAFYLPIQLTCQGGLHYEIGHSLESGISLEMEGVEVQVYGVPAWDSKDVQTWDITYEMKMY